MKNTLLLKTKIVWKRHSFCEKYFFTTQKDQIILLRMNNFPDEPLFTIINGLDILDIDDVPDIWYIEYG